MPLRWWRSGDGLRPLLLGSWVRSSAISYLFDLRLPSVKGYQFVRLHSYAVIVLIISPTGRSTTLRAVVSFVHAWTKAALSTRGQKCDSVSTRGQWLRCPLKNVRRVTKQSRTVFSAFDPTPQRSRLFSLTNIYPLAFYYDRYIASEVLAT